MRYMKIRPSCWRRDPLTTDWQSFRVACWLVKFIDSSGPNKYDGKFFLLRVSMSRVIFTKTLRGFIAFIGDNSSLIHYVYFSYQQYILLLIITIFLFCLWLVIQAVRKSHRGANSMMNRIPHNLILVTNAANLSRLYFLSVPSGLRENTILYVDFDSHNSVSQSGSNVPSEWLQFLDSFQPCGARGHMSREEQLLRERKRLRSYGITGYDYQQVDGVGHFAFSAANSVFVCSDSFDGIHQPVSWRV